MILQMFGRQLTGAVDNLILNKEVAMKKTVLSFLKVFIVVCVALMFVVAISGCSKEEGTMEKAGKKIDGAIDTAKEKADQTAKDVKEGAEKTVEAAKDTAKKTGEAVKEGADKTKDAVKDTVKK
jgi:F0F1-type ATP synthase membrane subunit b/b'